MCDATQGLLKEEWFRGAKPYDVTTKLALEATIDILKGLAEPIGDLVRSPGDVTSEIARCLDGEEMRQQGHWSTERLMERGWNYVDGAKCQLRGTMRGIVNQHELGVISKATLRRILEGGGPKLLPEPRLL